MKKCSKCGIEKDESEFNKNLKSKDGLYCHCKQCTKERKREYREKNKEKISEYNKRYHEANREYELKRCKKWRENNFEKRREYKTKNKERIKEYEREYSKIYRVENKEKISEYAKIYDKKRYEENKEQFREWGIKYRQEHKEEIAINKKEYAEKNKEKISEYHKRYNKENRAKFREWTRIYRRSPKGKETRRREQSKRRKLGHEPINSWYKGSECHHLRYSKNTDEQDNDITLYVPRKLHRSIPHNGNTGKNMKQINVACLEWYLSTTPDEERNPKAVKLYWNYCTLPEPKWSSNTSPTSEPSSL